MEQYIKNNLSDITYVSELILDMLSHLGEIKCQGLIRANNLRRTSCLRKLCAH
jgi:hypothetical protein